MHFNSEEITDYNLKKNNVNTKPLILLILVVIKADVRIIPEKYKGFFSCPYEVIETKDSIVLQAFCKFCFSASINSFNAVRYYSVPDTIPVKTIMYIDKKTNKGIVYCYTYPLKGFVNLDTTVVVESYHVANYKLYGNSEHMT